MPAKLPIHSVRHSPRLLLPLTLLNVIHALEEALPDDPSPVRIELRNAAAAICRAYRIRVDEVELAQQGAEDDGEAVQDEL